jgi:GNAT superfamily N-acetyltransferase
LLLEQLGYPSDPERLAGALADAQSGTGDVVVDEEEDSGRLVGFASFQLVYFFEDAAPRCRLTAIVVDEAARRTGAGRLLLEHVERIAVQAGCVAIEATSRRDVERGAAHRLYRDLGFVDGASASIFFTKPLPRRA